MSWSHKSTQPKLGTKKKILRSKVVMIKTTSPTHCWLIYKNRLTPFSQRHGGEVVVNWKLYNPWIPVAQNQIWTTQLSSTSIINIIIMYRSESNGKLLNVTITS